MNGLSRSQNDGIVQTGDRAAEALLLTVSAAPHVRGKESVSGTMLWTLLALSPAVCAASLLFGFRGLITVALTAAAAVATEWIITVTVSKRPFPTDCSACITGVLLALSLPGRLPLWMAPLGAIFAIIFVKSAFGGLGRNFLNPALAGRAFLSLSFPAVLSASAARTAPPVLSNVRDVSDTLLNLCIGYQSGWMGGSSAAALCLGAFLLWRLRIIDLTLPLSFIGSVFLLVWCANGSDVFLTGEAPLASLVVLLSGGVPLGAFFMATDPVTSPLTRRARLLFGAGCGILTFIFGKFGAANDGVMYAILLMNLVVPYCNRYLMHKPFGAAGRGKNASETPPDESFARERKAPAIARLPECNQPAVTGKSD